MYNRSTRIRVPRVFQQSTERLPQLLTIRSKYCPLIALITASFSFICCGISTQHHACKGLYLFTLMVKLSIRDNTIHYYVPKILRGMPKWIQWCAAYTILAGCLMFERVRIWETVSRIDTFIGTFITRRKFLVEYDIHIHTIVLFTSFICYITYLHYLPEIFAVWCSPR